MFLLGFVPQRGGILNIPSKNELFRNSFSATSKTTLRMRYILLYIYWYLFCFGGLVGMLRKKESMVLFGELIFREYKKDYVKRVPLYYIYSWFDVPGCWGIKSAKYF